MFTLMIIAWFFAGVLLAMLIECVAENISLENKINRQRDEYEIGYQDAMAIQKSSHRAAESYHRMLGWNEGIRAANNEISKTLKNLENN